MKCIHNKKWLGYKKEWSTDTCYNMNKLWKHYAKWKELDTKGHIWFHLYDTS